MRWPPLSSTTTCPVSSVQNTTRLSTTSRYAHPCWRSRFQQHASTRILLLIQPFPRRPTACSEIPTPPQYVLDLSIMGFFSKAFKGKEGASGTPKSKKKPAPTNGVVAAPPPKPHWDDAWTRKEVEPEEIQDLLRACTIEMKSRGMITPIWLDRPAADSRNSPGPAFLLIAFQARLRPQCSPYFRSQLLQHGQGRTSRGRAFGARVDAD